MNIRETAKNLVKWLPSWQSAVAVLLGMLLFIVGMFFLIPTSIAWLLTKLVGADLASTIGVIAVAIILACIVQAFKNSMPKGAYSWSMRSIFWLTAYTVLFVTFAPILKTGWNALPNTPGSVKRLVTAYIKQVELKTNLKAMDVEKSYQLVEVYGNTSAYSRIYYGGSSYRFTFTKDYYDGTIVALVNPADPGTQNGLISYVEVAELDHNEKPTGFRYWVDKDCLVPTESSWFTTTVGVDSGDWFRWDPKKRTATGHTVWNASGDTLIWQVVGGGKPVELVPGQKVSMLSANYADKWINIKSKNGPFAVLKIKEENY